MTDPHAAENNGYGEKIQHDYWHYFDIPFSMDGTKVEPGPSPNALTQIQLFTAALSSSESDYLKSFDLVWLLHLVGDVHQPLHATSRYSVSLPNGDTGGNAENVQVGTDAATHLHQIGDGLLGDAGSAADAITAAAALPAADPKAAAISDPAMWLIESFVIDQTDVYPGIGDDSTVIYDLSPSYMKNAKVIALARASLAGDRLANLLNGALR